MLKQLRLKKQIENLKAKRAEHDKRIGEIEKREEELAVALEEIDSASETADEDIKLIDEESDPLETEKKELEVKKSALAAEIEKLEKELEELNAAPAPEAKRSEEKTTHEGEVRNMSKIARGMKKSREERLAVLNQPEVRSFYENMRKAMETRAVTGLNLTIPQVIMDSIMDNLGEYSVLYPLVKVVKLNGTGRALVAGEAPEAVWTEMIGKLNELANTITDIEVDGYKLGGYIPLDNSLIEDSMLNLSAYVEDLLTESIAIALDKAILFGTGTKMPKGVIPAIYADYVADPLSGLRTTNIIKLSVADTTFAKIIETFKHIKRGKRGRGPITVLMNESTWLGTIVPKSLANNAAGAFVSVANQVFPGVGYKVEFSEEIPDNMLVAGDFTKYILAERAGVKGASSTEFLFTSDKTVFKASARYDGKPVKESAFVVVGLNNVDAAVSATFATDSANA
ncbi:phage major capsid protein [Proteiniclasticum sp. BAD-10]|uniref:Phage major capsid protein n=1 Tax=Proteiniclasticum sediminis TaxID=2804028 RepID=A0A941CSV7_9CLOT|nr:phage major capsid protein [Proteiniclasticum sediminis]MBR0576756.1 phage major capsid protein [Proteiniclasticum sediminis]